MNFKEKKEVIIHLSVDYGAQEFFWYFPKPSVDEFLSWWESQEDLIMYEKQPDKLPGKLMLAKSNEDYSRLYSLSNTAKVVLVDYKGGSYLILRDKKYLK